MITDALTERKQRQYDAEAAAESKQAETTVGGEVLEVDTAETVQTFTQANTLLTSTQHGWPRGAEVVAGRQLGQTPLLELVKGVIISQVTGGELALPFVEEGETPAELEAFRDTVRELLERDHVQGMEFDDLVAAAVCDIVDVGWAYWEVLPSANNEVPVVALKPIDALTIQHNLTDNGQFADDGLYYWHSPTAATVAGTIQPIELGGEPTPLEREQVVAIRGPGTARSNDPYGQSPAVRAREWLEVYNNSTADINRDYDDTQIPEGVFSVGENGTAKDLVRQLRQTRGDKRKAPVVDYEVDWTDIGFDTTDTRIMEQEWFLKMVMAMFGVNRNELGMTENTGLGTETPAQATLIYKKITKPFLRAFEQAIRTQLLPQFDAYDGQFDVEIRNVDPRQEIVDQEEARKRFTQGTMTYAEMKQELGEDVPDETTLDVAGETVDWAQMPRWVVEQMIRIQLDESGQGETESMETEAWRENVRQDVEIPPPGWKGDPDVEPELPDFDDDPVLGVSEAARQFGIDPLEAKQLDEVIHVVSSFIESVAYNRTRTPFMQITFNPEGYPKSTYWYSGVPEGLFFRFLQASSKGQHFNEFIRHTGRNNFDYVQVS